MKLLIDGYNLFKQIDGVAFLTSAQMTRYITLVRRYIQLKELHAVLVFDGGLQNNESYEKNDFLEIIYVGKNKTADDFIKDFLQTHRTKDILLVSSDRELNRVADYYSVPSIDVFDFWQFVKTALVEKKIPVQRSGHIIKISDSSNPELDALMSVLKVTSIKQDDAVLDNNPITLLKHSRIDKMLLQKVKKL